MTRTSTGSGTGEPAAGDVLGIQHILPWPEQEEKIPLREFAFFCYRKIRR
jgi:hypothetical protein